MLLMHDDTWITLGRSDFFPFREDLAERLEGYIGHIERRACGRIRDLHVVCDGQTVILLDRSRTCHAKQLAREAVFDMIGDHTAPANEIVVC